MKIFLQMTCLGDYISKLRLEKGWSYRDLAEKTPPEFKVSFATIQEIENGKTVNPGVKAIWGISKALNVHPMKLMLAYAGEDPERLSKDVMDESMEEALAIKKALDDLRKGKDS